MSRAQDLFDAAMTVEARRMAAKERNPSKIPMTDLRQEIDGLSSLFASPIPVPGDPAACSTLGRVFLVCCLDRWKVAKPMELEDILAAGTKEALEKAFASVNERALGDLHKSGMYSTAFPDTNASQAIFSAAPTYPIACPGTVSTASSRFAMNFSNTKGVNAIALATALARAFDIGGQIKSGFEIVADKGFLYDLLAEVDRPKAEAIRTIITAAMARTPAKNEVAAGEKVVLVPTGDGYVQLTPVYVQAMEAGIQEAKGNVRATEGRDVLFLHHLSYGGGQPVNTGLVGNLLRGRHEMLNGYPPESRLDTDHVERERIRTTGTLLKQPVSEQMDQLRVLDSPLRRRNYRNRDQFENALYDVVVECTKAFRSADTPIDSFVVAQLPAVEIEVLKKGFSNCGPNYRKAFVEHLSRHIAKFGNFNLESAIARRWLEDKVAAAMVGGGRNITIQEPAE